MAMGRVADFANLLLVVVVVVTVVKVIKPYPLRDQEIEDQDCQQGCTHRIGYLKAHWKVKRSRPLGFSIMALHYVTI
ncbi:hypothetical protein A3196_15965 [Candidatus Thiodiazotropha endoloripes]|uniref:Uncharacterized protein n=1 Tax=Candidatus Thiodiazotropha endoloripes TaxID=1818881 RepID=A0A1E2UU64_9GAMM|nr:hypothetical protein A3196_15965 [Candidatus Thiodiazotropha endoloripes]